uniref:Putative ovule protein n=1 Tax=Solanum chacoense TaxID=4108 RepID=A0A0V0GV16_SOLCH
MLMNNSSARNPLKWYTWKHIVHQTVKVTILEIYATRHCQDQRTEQRIERLRCIWYDRKFSVKKSFSRENKKKQKVILMFEEVIFLNTVQFLLRITFSNQHSFFITKKSRRVIRAQFDMLCP